MILGVFAGLWIGLGQGGVFLIIAALVERFLYAQRLGGTVDNGGEDSPLATLYFLAAFAFATMLLWALFPWKLLPSAWLPETGLPVTESPFTVNWLEYFGVNTEPLDNRLDIPVD